MAKCSRCAIAASHYQGHQHLCSMHYRFGQMRSTAKRYGKVVPTHEELEVMASKGTTCPDCYRKMNWLARNDQSTVACLQHYRDGTLAIVCRTCNTRHAFMPDDLYRDMPKDHRLCKGCETIKPLTRFSADNSRSGPMKVKSKCKTCSDIDSNNWRGKNREQYNEYQRAYRAKQRSERSSTDEPA